MTMAVALKQLAGEPLASAAVDPTAPLRLAEAVKIAFPRGGMTVSGLRREIARGRLAVEFIAGKQFTTLADIEEMRKLCRDQARARDSGNAQPGERTGASLQHQSGSSKMAANISPQDALRARLERGRQKPQSAL